MPLDLLRQSSVATRISLDIGLTLDSCKFKAPPKIGYTDSWSHCSPCLWSLGTAVKSQKHVWEHVDLSKIFKHFIIAFEFVGISLNCLLKWYMIIHDPHFCWLSFCLPWLNPYFCWLNNVKPTWYCGWNRSTPLLKRQLRARWKMRDAERAKVRIHVLDWHLARLSAMQTPAEWKHQFLLIYTLCWKYM